ncbi:MAG: LysE family transporter [Methanomicrobiales archaeon]|jgi:threonine/homoserine/homoserine lactone efflux protein|nr:LysE family transporter [Methanomicrobiales archaeon]
MSIPELAFMGFVIGLTGALAPGPTLIATIRSALHTGWTAGPKVTFGHIITEAAIIVLIVAGISSFPSTLQPAISMLGGTALVLFGGMTLSGARRASFSTDISMERLSGPVIAGFVTSVTNPYFWIWWFSVGSALLLSSMSHGIAGLVAFTAGHWASDLGWFTAVSVSIHHSKAMLSDRMYRGILLLCGMILIIFGFWFLIPALIS